MGALDQVGGSLRLCDRVIVSAFVIAGLSESAFVRSVI